MKMRYLQPAVRVVRTATDPTYAEKLYWSLNDKFQRMYDLARGQDVDLWLANDWTSLPIASRLAAEQGVSFAYDTHELAVDEYAQRWLWRFAHRPVIAAIERHNIQSAAFVSCVSAGIAKRLFQVHRMREPPLVIRNMTQYREVQFRPAGEKIRVLYHGVVSVGRGLESCIASVALWRPEFDLTIRGPCSSEYLGYLTRLAHEAGVADRVTFAPPVPMVDLVNAAAAHDVGLFALPSHSLQNVYALPNKLFEYMMAGLALCISDLPEMAPIVSQRKVGVLINSVSPEAIAEAIGRLSRPAIDSYKRNSLAAARDLNWEKEGQRFVDACAQAVSPRQTMACP